MIGLMLQKGVKSLQLRVNEMMMFMNTNDTVSNSAFTQARVNLDYKAFIELNQTSVVDVMYEDDDISTYKGMRVIGIDGSKVILPNEANIHQEFGKITQRGFNSEETHYAYAMASVMYDVLNRIALDASLTSSSSYEVDLAIKHLKHSRPNDLLLYDRGYPSYKHIATLIQADRKFVMRCSRASFKQARTMLQGKGRSDQIATIKVHHTKKEEIEKHRLPQEVQVRFVRVKLSTGEYEVLVTNLLDKATFPAKEFKHVCHMRWGVEGFYSILKTRLTLENFSGKSVHSVYQDFYSTVFLSGLESILTQDIDEELAQKKTKNLQKVNRHVSFNAIKNKALALLFTPQDTDDLLEQLEKLFRTNPVQIRSKRKVPRKNSSDYRLLDYSRRRKKHCF